MLLIARQFCAVLTALAVLLVGVTCSSAGCVLQRPGAQTGPARHDCCAGATGQPLRSHDAPILPPQGRCPLCRTSVMIGKTVEKSSQGQQRIFSPVLFAALPANAAVPCSPASFRPAAFIDPIAGSHSTLLALHCALLT